jgi:hypothetical protein
MQRTALRSASSAEICHRARVVDDVVEGDGQRRRLPLHHVPEGIPHEQDVDLRGVEDL